MYHPEYRHFFEEKHAYTRNNKNAEHQTADEFYLENKNEYGESKCDQESGFNNGRQNVQSFFCPHGPVHTVKIERQYPSRDDESEKEEIFVKRTRKIRDYKFRRDYIDFVEFAEFTAYQIRDGEYNGQNNTIQ